MDVPGEYGRVWRDALPGFVIIKIRPECAADRESGADTPQLVTSVVRVRALNAIAICHRGLVSDGIVTISCVGVASAIRIVGIDSRQAIATVIIVHHISAGLIWVGADWRNVDKGIWRRRREVVAFSSTDGPNIPCEIEIVGKGAFGCVFDGEPMQVIINVARFAG